MTAAIRVLVVDDDAGARALHARWAGSTEGFAVVGTAASGSAALGLAEHGVDLVLLDMRLPDLSGIEVLHRLRTLSGSAIDVLVISSSNDQVTVRQALAARVVGYLIKPFDQQVLRDRLLAYAGERRVRDAEERELPLGQGDVDRLLATGSLRTIVPADSEPAPLPKGLSQVTLDRIVAALDPVVAVSSDAVATSAGVSRATARRYLDQLVRDGVIDLAHQYGRRGRPQVLYRLAPAP